MKLFKLSLAAVVAAGALSSVSAAPLEEAIKDIDVSGFGRYRFQGDSFKSNVDPVLGGLKIAEGQEKALAERVQKADAECRKGRQQEQPEASLDRPADQRRIERGHVALLLEQFHSRVSHSFFG